VTAARTLAAALAAALLCGCLGAPEIVVVDRETALEQQAAGTFSTLERKLARSGIAPRPVPLTPDQLETLGLRAPEGRDRSDVDAVDALLVQRCIGEGREGSLVESPETCRGGVDRLEVRALVERTNRARAQLWRWLQSREPGASLDAVRLAWTRFHARGVVCGGWIQREDGAWEAKAC
jgi:hypothetical protein